MNELIEAWLDTYRAAGRSAGTVRARASYVRTLARELDPLTLTADELLAYLASRRLSPEGRKSMVVALRSFYRWCHRRGLVDVDLAAELPPVTVPRGVPKPITERALREARARADEETRLMLDLGARMGLRRGEIARVHGDHVTDFGLVVKGKGGRERMVPVHELLEDRLGGLRGWAFPSTRRPGPVTPDYVADRLARVLPAPWTPHSLRHRFATEAHDGTMNMRAVQELLGHASIETTMRYVAVSRSALTAAVRAVA